MVLSAALKSVTGLPLTAPVGLTVLEGVPNSDFFDFSDSGVCGGFSADVRDILASESSLADVWDTCPASIAINE